MPFKKQELPVMVNDNEKSSKNKHWDLAILFNSHGCEWCHW